MPPNLAIKSCILCVFFLAINRLSVVCLQNFPFSIMSINITRIALHALREQLLNKLANSTGDLITVFNNFYVACFFHLYLIWRDGGKTIHDSGYVMQGWC